MTVTLKAMYPLLKPLLFRLEPEQAHDLTMSALAFASRHPGLLRFLETACEVKDARLEREVFGLKFPNPIGLAAGFDKNARAVPALSALGFGFVEVGSVTAVPQPGNPKPRLFRLPKDEALINRLGFNNEGAERVAARLERLVSRGGKPNIPIGVNLGKSKAVPLEEAAGDYLSSLERLWNCGDYFVINVSSPNTPGLRDLQESERLEPLLEALQAFRAKQPTPKPLFLKIAPDLSFAQIDEIAALALRRGVSGLVATNTTALRHGLMSAVDEPGGLSGRPLRERSLAVLRHLHKTLGERLPIVSVGGVATWEDALERLQAGASLVQLYTGLVYRGPGLVKRLNEGLVGRLEQGGWASLGELTARRKPI